MADVLSDIQLRLPKWLGYLYAALAVILIPWIQMLSYSLPSRHLSHHWDMAWVGYDIMLLTAVLLTALLSFRRSAWVCLSAMSVFTLLIVDAWFDVLTSRPGIQTDQAIMLAVLVELPLAALSFWLSYRVASDLVSARKPR